MNVKCGVNGEVLTENQIFVCHHCGMPVCEEHGSMVAADDAFAGSAVALSELPETPSTPPPGTVVPQAAPAPRVAVPVPAMHCRDCAHKFHGGVIKKPSWIDPRSAVAGITGSAGRP